MTTKIKNLYLKIETKKIVPTDDEVEKILSHNLAQQVKRNKGEPLNHTPEQLNDIRAAIKEMNTVNNHQLRKISKIPHLAHFINLNIRNIKEVGQAILLKDTQYQELLKGSKIHPDTKNLPIYLNSEVLFTTVYPINKEILQRELKNNTISVDRYDELLDMLENNKLNGAEEQEGNMEKDMT